MDQNTPEQGAPSNQQELENETITEPVGSAIPRRSGEKLVGVEMSDEEANARIRNLELSNVFIALANKLQQVQQVTSTDSASGADEEKRNVTFSEEQMNARKRKFVADYKAGLENVFEKLIADNKDILGLKKAKKIFEKSMKNIEEHPKYPGALKKK